MGDICDKGSSLLNVYLALYGLFMSLAGDIPTLCTGIMFICENLSSKGVFIVMTSLIYLQVEE